MFCLGFTDFWRIPGWTSLTESSLLTHQWIFRRHQLHHFRKEVECLWLGRLVSRSSPLHKLHLILDDKWLLWAGGRLDHASLPYSQQHPVILHGKSSVGRLLVHQLHIDHSHISPTALMGILSRERLQSFGSSIIGQIHPGTASHASGLSLEQPSR